MNVHLRIGDNRTFSLKQAVLVYQDGTRAFATLHEVKCRPNEAPYLCAGQSVTTGFLETLAKGLGASMAAEVLPEYVLARTPELVAWWSRARLRLMFFGDGNDETKKLNGQMFPHPGLGVHDPRAGTVRTCAHRRLPAGSQYAPEKRAVLEHRLARSSMPRQYASARRAKRRLPAQLGKRVFRQRIHPSQWCRPTDRSSGWFSWPVVKSCRTKAVSYEASGGEQANASGVCRETR